MLARRQQQHSGLTVVTPSLKIMVVLSDADVRSHGTMVLNAIYKAGINEVAKEHATTGHAFYDPVVVRARSFTKHSDFDVLISLGSAEIIDTIDAEMTTYSERQRWVHIESIKDFVDNCGAYLTNAYRGYIMMLPGLEMPTPPTISIVTTLFRATPDAVAAMWASVSAQDASYRNWEWIIVDDNFADDAAETRELVETTTGYDSRVVYTRLGFNRSGYAGLVKSRGFAVASGLYIVNLPQTKMLGPNLFGHLISFLVADKQARQCGFVFTDVADTDSITSAPELDSVASIGAIASSAGHIWRRDVHNAVGGYNPKLVVAEDYELIARAFASTAPDVFFTKLCVSGFVWLTSESQEPSVFQQHVVKMIREAYEPAILNKLHHCP